MESTQVPTEDPTVIARAERSPAEARHPDELFKYSEWVHVGPGAEECEDGMTGACADPLHFHAWCRLPNQFQHQSIVEKALAAKARRIRQYRDPDSDPSVVLDGELEAIEHDMSTEVARQTYVDEIVFKDFMRDYFEVMQEMTSEEPESEAEEEDGIGPWSTIEEDRERLRAIEELPPEERNETEHEELRQRLDAYNVEVERRVKEQKQAPVRESMENRSIDELRNLVREGRIAKDAMQSYMSTYTIWEQYIGTLKPQPQGMPSGKPGVVQERVFSSIEHLKAAAPEVIRALDVVFTDLDGEFGSTIQMGEAGKGS